MKNKNIKISSLVLVTVVTVNLFLPIKLAMATDYTLMATDYTLLSGPTDIDLSYDSNTNTPAYTVSLDFDKDGKKDLAVASSDGTVVVLKGNGDGTFATAVPLSSTNNYASTVIKAADLNKDGYLDLVASNTVARAITVYQNHKDGSFESGVEYQSSANLVDPKYMTIGDFDGDTYPDIAVSNTSASGGSSYGLSVLINWGVTPGHTKGTFKAPVIHQYDRNGWGADRGITSADFNGDGVLDIAHASANDPSTAYIIPGLVDSGTGKGTGAFDYDHKVSLSTPFPNQGNLIETADVNGDGLPDIVVTAGVVYSAYGEESTLLYVFLNTSQGHSFSFNETPNTYTIGYNSEG